MVGDSARRSLQELGDLQLTTLSRRLSVSHQHCRVSLTFGNLRRQSSLPEEYSGTGRTRLSTSLSPVPRRSVWYSSPHPLLLGLRFTDPSSGPVPVASPEGARGSSSSLALRHRVSVAPDVSKESGGGRRDQQRQRGDPRSPGSPSLLWEEAQGRHPKGSGATPAGPHLQ
ncbi:hypothetical protein NDU88_005641 [Pleurodeles waltl]|uniref:Uncharacterized protein n=1 Tax=Pleurodeles waltl TaxID=8319 RepID=A0AAV7LM11_PLEWA|nr:hypothetical protein NDU88_005641 [Pleurodeles waltl]